jgi:hypothetical protein
VGFCLLVGEVARAGYLCVGLTRCVPTTIRRTGHSHELKLQLLEIALYFTVILEFGKCIIYSIKRIRQSRRGKACSVLESITGLSSVNFILLN